MTLKPAPPNHGIRFQRVDICGHPVVAAHYDRVVDTFLATSIGFDGVVISTIEHLMAAFLGCGVDNALVEIDGPEVPVLDGSAGPYRDLLERVGLHEQIAFRQSLRLEQPLVVREGDAYIKAFPSEQLEVRYAIDFPHPLVGRQEFSWSFDEHTFSREIAPARTFGFLRDVEKLKSMGLARGGSLENAVVFDERRLLNEDGLRYANECVRHKILDFLGDMALAGMPLIGSFEVYKAGHALHNKLLRTMTAVQGPYARSKAAFMPAPVMSPAVIPSFVESFPPLAKHL